MAEQSLPKSFTSNNSGETWNPIPEYEGHYEVSDYGYVRSLIDNHKKPRKEAVLRRVGTDSWGYRRLNLSKNGKTCSLRICVLVLTTFRGKRPVGMEASHLNGVKTDDRLTNLDWETPRQNNRRRLDHGAVPRGENAHLSVLKDDDIVNIKSRLASGESQRSIAMSYGVCHSTIGNIKLGRTWTHIAPYQPQGEGKDAR